jgi:hypothetical protein
MSGPREPDDTLSVAEQALRRQLELLRDDPPTPSSALSTRVVRAARWQRAVRRPLMTIGVLAGAVRDGVALLLVSRKRR